MADLCSKFCITYFPALTSFISQCLYSTITLTFPYTCTPKFLPKRALLILRNSNNSMQSHINIACNGEDKFFPLPLHKLQNQTLLSKYLAESDNTYPKVGSFHACKNSKHEYKSKGPTTLHPL